MTDRLATITSCISKEIENFEKELSEALVVEDGFLRQILNRVAQTKGKRIRPILIFLIAKALGKVTDMTYRGAVVVELLHSASLLHDDVIDNAELRRQKPTINYLFGNKLSILAGDYLYGKALQTIKTKEDFSLMDVFAKIAVELPQGEILELQDTDTRNTNIEDYLRVIYCKTASLVSAACEIGLRSSLSKQYQESITVLGDNLGLAYQIKDDLLDYDTENNLGKGFGNDIRECKITLPIIYLFESLKGEQKVSLFNLFFKQGKTEQEVNTILQMVNNSQALSKTKLLQEDYSRKAMEVIDSLPNNEYTAALGELVKFLIYRNQ